MTSQAEIVKISEQLFTTHLVLLHKPSGNYYCITREAYVKIQEEKEDVTVSKFLELRISCNLFDKETSKITDVVESFYVRDLLAAFSWKKDAPVQFANVW